MKIYILPVLSLALLLVSSVVYFGTSFPLYWSMGLALAASLTGLLGLALDKQWQSIKTLKVLLISVVLTGWIFLLFAYAIPTVNRAYSGFVESDTHLSGVINCTSKHGEQYSFSMQSPGTSGIAGREGLFGRGDPYIEITQFDKVKKLRLKDEWHCTDSNGASQILFRGNP